MIYKKKTILLLGISIALLVALISLYAYFFVVMQGKNARALEAVVRVKSLEGKEENLSQNARALKQYAEEIKKLDSYIVRESDAVVFAQKLESLGADAGVRLKLESLEQVNPTKDTVALNVRLRGGGDFSGVMRFLGMLENFPARFDFTSVRTFRAQEGGLNAKEISSDWAIVVEFKVLSYRRD